MHEDLPFQGPTLPRVRGMVGNATWLFAARIATYGFPMLTIPRLSRVLGAEAWGQVVFAQVVALFLSLIVDFGFGLSGCREVARHRGDFRQLRDIVAGVLGVRLFLAGSLFVVLAAIFLAVPHTFPRQEAMVLGAIFLTLSQGFNMTWFFQGMESMATIAVFDTLAYALYTIGIFTVVNSPLDGWIVLILQGSFGILEAATLFCLIWREIGVVLPRPSLAWRAFQTGRGLFAYRLLVAVQGSVNSFLLGIMLPVSAVGIFAGADKINRILVMLIGTAGDVIYPRISYLLGHSIADAAHLSRFTAVLVLAGSCAAALLLEILAGFLLPWLLGSAFVDSVPVFRILLLALPFSCVTACFGTQWMLALGREVELSALLCCGIALNAGLTVSVATRFGAAGVAGGVVASEVFITVSILVILRVRDLLPSQALSRGSGRRTH